MAIGRETPVSVAAPSTAPPPAPPRALGVGVLLASAGLVGSFAALGLNTIAVARIEGPHATGLVALAAQVVVIATLVAGIGLRTSVTYRVGAGLWSPRSALLGALRASIMLGVAGAVVGLGVYGLLRHSAMSAFNLPMAAALMAALPFVLAWWIVPAVPLARDRFEEYALLTLSAPVAVLVACPIGAVIGGSTGTVLGFAAGYVIGGLATAAWGLRFARVEEARGGPEHGVRAAGGFGLRAWVNDLFQFVNVRPDLFIVSAYFGAAATGVYSITISITSLVWIASQPLASVVLPRTASLRAAAAADPAVAEAEPRLAAAEPHETAVRHAVLVCGVAAVALVPALVIAPAVWGPGFGKITELGLIMAPGVAMLGVARVMVAAFTGRGAANHALAVGFVSFPVTLVAFLLVVPDHGSVGAAIVSCASYVAVSALSAILFFRGTHASVREALLPRRGDFHGYLELARRLRRRLRPAYAAREAK
jgi:O-antigen/teichoic acid export membrane protein